MDDGAIESLDELRDAYIEAGGSCDDWVVNDDEETGEGAACDGIYLSWFENPDLVGIQLGERLGNPYDAPVLVGANWVVYSPDAETLQPSMGGSIMQLTEA